MDDRTHPHPRPEPGIIAPGIELKPSPLLLQYWKLFLESGLNEPVIDLACGKGHNGLFLASRGVPVVLIDRSEPRLALARRVARHVGGRVDIKRMDLEQGDTNLLPAGSAGGILIFRYLHRPLMPAIESAISVGGILIYETFTRDQPKYGKPHNPDYLLKPGELKAWFAHWELIHYFEGIMEAPRRATAQIVCRKTTGYKKVTA